MSQDQSIKIRALPRKNEKAKDEPATPKTKSTAKRWIIYLGTSSALVLAMAVAIKNDSPVRPQKIQHSESSSLAARENARENALVTRHLQDSVMHRQMMVQAQQLENAKVKTKDLEAEDYALDSSRTFGVQFDQEDLADRVYEDLNLNSKTYSDQTPDEKISARLANRRWVNDLERRERITFIKNFIKSAYDRGYEVEINENLVVVGVKRVTDTKKFNIDQIVDKIAAKQR